MNEKVPDSIPNNHTIQEQPGKLLVAESRMNHSYEEHPHPINGNGEADEVHEKTRGIVYNETQLAGKPFIIAERPGSQDQSQKGAAASEVPGFASAEQDETPESIVRVHYEPNEEGFVQTAFEITKEDPAVDLSNLECVLITTKDRTYFVNGKDIDDLTLLENQDHEPGEIDNWVFEDDERMPTIRIGGPLNIRGENIDGPISKIEIKGMQLKREEFDKLGDEYQTRGEDPFQKAEDLLDEAYPDEVEIEHIDVAGLGDLVEPISDPSPKGLRARVRHILGRAGDAVQKKWAQADEYLHDDEKGKRRSITALAVGAVILAGVSYLELKGMESGGTHGTEGAIMPTFKPHHHEAMQHAHQATQSTNGGTTAPGGHEAAQHKDVLSLGHEGDTIEGQVAGYLHTDLRDPAVTKVTEVVLHNQGISWDDARHLPIGYSFNMPPQHVIEELTKASA